MVVNYKHNAAIHRPQAAAKRSLGHLATWGPVCGVGAGDRPILHPPNLHNGLQGLPAPLLPLWGWGGHCPNWPLLLSQVSIRFDLGGPSYLLLWWCYQEHEEDKCPFHPVEGTWWGRCSFTRKQHPSLTVCRRAGTGGVFSGPRGFPSPASNAQAPFSRLQWGVQLSISRGGLGACCLVSPHHTEPDPIFRRHVGMSAGSHELPGIPRPGIQEAGRTQLRQADADRPRSELPGLRTS